MACGSCGQRRAVVSESQAQAIASGRVPAKYYVTDPATGEKTEFTDITLAKIFRREVSGTLTTS